MKSFDIIILAFISMGCLTLGLAPYIPEPHVIQKLGMLFNGDLSKPIDIFDLILHATPWAFLVWKITETLTRKDED